MIKPGDGHEDPHGISVYCYNSSYIFIIGPRFTLQYIMFQAVLQPVQICKLRYMLVLMALLLLLCESERLYSVRLKTHHIWGNGCYEKHDLRAVNTTLKVPNLNG